MLSTRRSFLGTGVLGPALLAAATRAPAPRKRKLLILGGTRFLGPALIEAATAAGHEITLFNRGKTDPQRFKHLEQRIGDRDTGDLASLKTGTWDCVIDNSGYAPSHVQATAELLRDRVQQYLFVSTISVYADTSAALVGEDTKVATVTDEVAAQATTIREASRYYGAMKARCEQAAEKAMPGRVAHVRPGLIVGPEDNSDRFTYWPVRVKRGGEMLVPGAPTDPLQIIDVRDLADWLVKIINQKTTGRFNAVGPRQPLTMGEMLRVCKEVSGSATTFTYADAKFLEEQKVEDGDFPLWSPPGSEFGGLHQASNARAIKRGLTFRPLADTVKQTLAYFEGLPPERQHKPKTGMTAEREAQLLNAWKKRKV